MNITKMTSTVADRVREELKIYLSQFTSTHEIEGIKVELGNCSYDEAMAQYQLKIKVDGVETREQKALKMYAQLDGLDLDKKTFWKGKLMTLTTKIMTMICLMMGTALFVISLPNMLDYVGLIDILSHDIAIILLIGGFYLISNTKEKTYVRSN